MPIPEKPCPLKPMMKRKTLLLKKIAYVHLSALKHSKITFHPNHLKQ